ncbi:uncharacterized protein E0L32_002205 [Thyridium curvatum]|uniref:Peptidyl-prolyl cis-trans isomerase-like 4 n=1 Tax=Thyridium curvatum TaxID=1093900 RepID=A0A507APF9_9PEZI|nr:uncharacterized protein E0L32_002205 [Thyridium curvatum]TPX06709.1 hypothetical protein E0L32_002205 [Thyridium curvatum]
MDSPTSYMLPDPLTDLHHNTNLALRKYLLLREQHESLQQHLEQLRPLGACCSPTAVTTTGSSSLAGSPTRGSFSASPPDLPAPYSTSPAMPSATTPAATRTRNHQRRRSSLPAPKAVVGGPGGVCLHRSSTAAGVLDEATLQEVADEEARLFDVNEGIKRTLTELLNCETVRNDRCFRMWVQCRLMDTEKELRSLSRDFSPPPSSTTQNITNTATGQQGSLSLVPLFSQGAKMSVLLETSAGDIVIDLLVDYAPKLCENFLKLCKVKYYNFSPIHTVQKSFSFQTGDPLGPLSAESDGGSSIWGLLSSDPAKRTFPAFFHPKLKHLERGTVSMATAPHPSDPDTRLAGSQFIVTLGDNTDYLDGRAAIFGKVVEGFDALEKINDAIVDPQGHPLVDIRIKHTVVLDDPYPDPDGLREPDASPPPSKAQLATVRIAEDEGERLGEDEGDEEAGDKAERDRREREARAQALTLEMMGDLPFAEVKPPENVLFVCKLNPVTQDADLELIFSRFGKILSCEVIRDAKTGDSLQYAFVEYEDKAACEQAYFKMQGVLIDDRRIHVDFSQSVSKLSDAWRSDTNSKRRRQANGGKGKGGWGGVRELEKWRKYREEDDEGDGDRRGDYDMVYGAEEMRGRHERSGPAPAARREEERGGDGGRGGIERGGKDGGRAGDERNGRRGDDRWEGGKDRPRDRDWDHRDRRRSRSPRRDRDRYWDDRPRGGGGGRDRDRRDRDRDGGRDRGRQDDYRRR